MRSSFLQLPTFSYDYIKVQNSFSKTGEKIDNKFIEDNRFLVDYHWKDLSFKKGNITPSKGKQLISLFKKIYDKKFNKVKELHDVFKNPENHNGQKFLIKG